MWVGGTYTLHNYLQEGKSTPLESPSNEPHLATSSKGCVFSTLTPRRPRPMQSNQIPSNELADDVHRCARLSQP